MLKCIFVFGAATITLLSRLADDKLIVVVGDAMGGRQTWNKAPAGNGVNSL